MKTKKLLRKKYFLIRKKNYFEINPTFFDPLSDLVKEKYKKKNLNISSFYPSFYEVDTTKIFETSIIKNNKISLPCLIKKNIMHFYQWEKNETLKINQYGMLEPAYLTKKIIPDIILVPLLAFDNQKNRLGYGGGYYDRFIKKILNVHKKIITIGIAFSFQKHNKIPVNNTDVKLNYILTEKGLF